VTSALEPTRLAKPSRVARDALTHVRLLARVEAAEWWRRTLADEPVVIDLASAWIARMPEGTGHDGTIARMPEGTGHDGTIARTGALAWVELRGEEALRRGWID
jgi:hypothetical protein